MSATNLSPEFSAGAAGRRTALLARRHEVLGPNSLLFYEEPLEIVRGIGCELWDADGLRYLDAYNNVPHVGHCHPELVARAAEQLATLNIHSRYLHESLISYGERLLKYFPARHDRVMAVCTGSEANELAIRIARHRSGQQGILVSASSYHGNSTLLSGLATALRTVEPFPDFAATVDIDLAKDALELDRLVAEAIDRLRQRGIGLAAFLIDPLFSFEGLPQRAADFLDLAIRRVRSVGGVYIADEVQSGFGRVGEAIWGWRLHGGPPDMVTLGKAIANGYPMGAVVGSSADMDRFTAAGTTFHTFAGNPVAAVMADGVLDITERDGLARRAEELGRELRLRLRQIAQGNGAVRDVRGHGLFVGVELVDGEIAGQIVEQMRRGGVLVGRIGRGGAVVKIRPPLCFSLEDVGRLSNVFAAALAHS